MNEQTFGKKLLELLKQKKITQKKISDDLGVNVQAINRYIKSDRTPRLAFIKRVAKVLEVPVTYFVNDYDDPENVKEISPKKIDEFAHLKVIGSVKAGKEFAYMKNYIDEIFVNKKHLGGYKEVYAVRNVSDTMSPLINPADIIVIATDITAEELHHGDIVMMRSPDLSDFLLGRCYRSVNANVYHFLNYPQNKNSDDSIMDNEYEVVAKVLYSSRGYLIQ